MRAFAVFLLLTAATARAVECDDTPEGLIESKRLILSLARKVKDPKEFERRIQAPLNCLLGAYKNSGGFTKYLAGACLRPLMGEEEIPQLPKGAESARLTKTLIERELGDDLKAPSFLARFAEAEWSEYMPFCTIDELCYELLPDEARIAGQGDMQGASSLLVLANAYRRFQGPSRAKVGRLLQSLHKKIPRKDRVKRKMIDEIHRDLFGSPPLSRLS